MCVIKHYPVKVGPRIFYIPEIRYHILKKNCSKSFLSFAGEAREEDAKQGSFNLALL